MLTAIGFWAAVGYALAFKAKTFGADTYCTTTIQGGVCHVPRFQTKFETTTVGAAIKYVRTFNPNNCFLGPACTATGVAEM